METRKLYYEDCHLTEFTARVTGCRPAEKGYHILLDATAFYPEGGGQACDTGTLGEARVTDVREKDGEILHLCDRPQKEGETVTGKISWDRRFDLMQQHSGEHIVSGIIHRRYGWHNVGFHMGADTITIDFDGPVPEEALGEIEAEANEAVFENLPIRCWYPEESELPGIPYRSKRALPWPVRIVEIPGYDICACCGVHVKSTGEIGSIRLLSCIKFRQGVRMEMFCGRRALRDDRELLLQNRQVSQALSAKPLETGAAADRIVQALNDEKFRCSELRKRLFRMLAQQYRGQGNVFAEEDGLSSAELRKLAELVSASSGGMALTVTAGEQGCGFCIIGEAEPVSAFGRTLVKALGGRGGGRDGAFQGSLPVSCEEVRAYIAGSDFYNQNSQ